MSVIYIVAALLSVLAFYLATAHQQVRPALRAQARWLRVLGWALALLAVAAGSVAQGPWAGLFCALTAFMLGAVALPYLDTWRRLRRERAHVG